MIVSNYTHLNHLRAEDVSGNYTTAPGTGVNAGVPSIDWPRGKVSSQLQQFTSNSFFVQRRLQVLGGSSALNFLVWDRASSVEYDAWERLGNSGWVNDLKTF